MLSYSRVNSVSARALNWFLIIYFVYRVKRVYFVEISQRKILFEPSDRGVVDTKGKPVSTCLRISREKKLIFQKLNSFLIVYFI